MAIALAGSTSGGPVIAYAASDGALDQLSVSLTGCVAGNGIVFVAFYGSKNISNATLTSESNATLLPELSSTGANGQVLQTIGYFKNLQNSGNKTLKLNFNNNNTGRTYVVVFEVSGADSTDFLDQNASAHLESTAASQYPTHTLTTNSQNCFVVSGVVGGTGSNPTETGSLTELDLVAYDSNFQARIDAAYTLDSGATSSPAPAWTLGASDTYGLVSAAFAPAASLTKKLKLLAHSSAAGATGIAGVVWALDGGSGIAGAEIGEFTGKSFEASLEGDKAVLKVPVADFGGGSLNVNDQVKVFVRNTTNFSDIWTGTIIEE